MKITDKQTAKIRRKNLFTKSYDYANTIIMKIWYNGHYESFIIDKKDRSKISRFQWSCKRNNGNIVVYNKEFGIQLNRYLTDNLDNSNIFVSFRNGNIYDYRKRNLLLNSNRTGISSNVYHKINNDTIQIIIRSRKYGIEKILIDKKHYELIRKYNWHIKHKNLKYKYAITQTTDNKQINLSNLLYGKRKLVYLNNNPLDLRSSNIKFKAWSKSTYLKKLIGGCYQYLKLLYNDNEYGDIELSINNVINDLKHKKIPNEYDEKITKEFSFRNIIVYLQGFVLLDKKIINKLSKYLKNKKVLEVMSGCGSLSYCLKKNNVDIIATDDYSWDDKWYKKWNNKIEQLDAVNAVKKYKNVDVVIMAWPYMDSIAYDVLKTMREYNPKAKLLFIGEDIGGCTADSNFYDNIEIIDEEETEEINKVFKSFEGIHDKVIICK